MMTYEEFSERLQAAKLRWYADHLDNRTEMVGVPLLGPDFFREER